MRERDEDNSAPILDPSGFEYQPLAANGSSFTFINRTHKKFNRTARTAINYNISFSRKGNLSLSKMFKTYLRSNSSARTNNINLPTNANASDAVEFFVKYLFENRNNTADVTEILKILGEALSSGAECDKEIGGALYTSSTMVGDMISTAPTPMLPKTLIRIYSTLIVYDDLPDCPPVVKIIQKLIGML